MYLILLAIAAITTLPGLASAQADAPKLRVNVDTTLVSFGKTTYSDGLDPDESEEIKQTNFGFGESLVNQHQMFGMGLGYLPIDNLTVGARLELGGGSSKYEGSMFEWDMRQFAYAALPYIEYKFLSGVFQPFVQATVGYRGSAAWEKDNDDEKIYLHLVEFGGAVGAHFFLAKQVSLDASISATGNFGKMKSAEDASENFESDLKRFKLAGVVGLSGWF